MLTGIQTFKSFHTSLNNNHAQKTENMINPNIQDTFIRTTNPVSFSGNNKALYEEKLKLRRELYSPDFNAEKFLEKLKSYHEKGGNYEKLAYSDLLSPRASLHLSDIGNLFEMEEDYNNAQTFYKFAHNSYKALPITYKNANTMRLLVMNESRIQKKIDNETEELHDKMLKNFASDEFEAEKFYKDLYNEKFIKYGSIEKLLNKAERCEINPETKINRLMELGELFIKDSKTVINRNDIMQNPKYKEILRKNFETFTIDNDYKEYDNFAWCDLNIYMKHTGLKFFGTAIHIDNNLPEGDKHIEYILKVLHKTEEL